MTHLWNVVARELLITQLLLCVGAVCMAVVHVGVVRGLSPARGAVLAARAMVVLAFVLPWSRLLVRGQLSLQVDALVVSAGLAAPEPRVGMPQLHALTGPRLWLLLTAVLGAVGIALCAYRVWQYARLASHVRSRPLLRRIGKVDLRLADERCGPASLWLPGRAVVLLPQSLLLSPRDARLALGHELEHHRRRDPLWAILHALVQSLCFWNPAAHLLSRLVDQWQELACDDALTARPRVACADYATCLLHVAERALASPAPLAAVRMAAPRSTLRKRVDRMFTPRREKSWITKTLTFIAILGLGASALAANAAPKMSGTLAKEDVQRTILAHKAEVRRCYEQALATQPGLGGRLVLRFVIGTDGHVRQAEDVTADVLGPSGTPTTDAAPPAGAKTGLDAVSSCVLGAVKTWTFPAPRGGDVTVSYPFTFAGQSSSKSGGAAAH